MVIHVSLYLFTPRYTPSLGITQAIRAQDINANVFNVAAKI